jgi:exosome complex RNA-binding protein Rrp42 (RNase PH superfamily)
MLNYSQNELDFFRTLLFDYDIRVDGRSKLSLRDFDTQMDVIPSCLSSLKISYNDNQKEMLFAVKGEIIPKASLKDEKLLYVSVDSMYRIDDLKLKREIENYIENLILSKINPDNLKISKSHDEYYWRLYVDIYIFDVLKMSLLQLLMIGVKSLIRNIKLPRLVLFTNEITGNIEFDLVEVYEDVSEKEKEYSLDADLSIPDVYVFSVINNSIFLDPTEEEFSIANSIVIISSHNDKITNVQSIGSSVDIQKLSDISSLIKSL